MNLEIVFSVDPTGHDDDIVEYVRVPETTCLYCLHDKNNRLIDTIKQSLTDLGYDLSYYFNIMKIYVAKTQWNNIDIIYGKIVGVDDDKVTIKCLIDVSNILFESRQFHIEPFIDSVDLLIGNYVSISIFTKSGIRIFAYGAADDHMVKNYLLASSNQIITDDIFNNW